MNLVDTTVTKVLSKPFVLPTKAKWAVKVLAETEGHLSETHVIVDTQEEAEKVDIGYKFLS